MLAKARLPLRELRGDEEKHHLVSAALIQVMVHQCTRLLVATKITRTMRQFGAKMPRMMKGIWATKMWQSSGRMWTVLGKICIRSMREMIRSRCTKTKPLRRPQAPAASCPTCNAAINITQCYIWKRLGGQEPDQCPTPPEEAEPGKPETRVTATPTIAPGNTVSPDCEGQDARGGVDCWERPRGTEHREAHGGRQRREQEAEPQSAP